MLLLPAVSVLKERYPTDVFSVPVVKASPAKAPSAVLFALENKLNKHLYNVGSGIDLSIKDLAEMIQNIVKHKGKIIWDKSKPEGTPRKLMDSSKMYSIGWEPKTDLENGISEVYEWYLNLKNE